MHALNLSMSLFLFLLVTGLAATSACGSSCTFLFTCFQFSHITTLKTAEFECKKTCLDANEIANWGNNISNHTLMNECLQNGSAAVASALCIKTANKGA